MKAVVPIDVPSAALPVQKVDALGHPPGAAGDVVRVGHARLPAHRRRQPAGHDRPRAAVDLELGPRPVGSSEIAPRVYAELGRQYRLRPEPYLAATAASDQTFSTATNPISPAAGTAVRPVRAAAIAQAANAA